MANDNKPKKKPKKSTYVKKTNTKKKTTTKKTNTKKYVPKKNTIKKSNIKKKTVKKQQTKKPDLTDTQLLDVIKIKKEEKRLELEEKRAKQKANENDLIITREINTTELHNYLQQEQEELENTLLLNELAEKVTKELEKEEAKESPKEEIIEKKEEPKKEKKKLKQFDKKSRDLTIGQLLSEDFDEDETSKEEISEIVEKKNYGQAFILVVLILLFLAICGAAIYNIKPSNAKKEDRTTKREEPKEGLNIEDYNDCLNKKYNIEDTNEKIEEYITDINSFLSTTYNVSIIYKDLEREYTYTYNTNRVYYAASTIKALVALYTYEKAREGEINLDDTLTYNMFYPLDASKYMSTKNYGDKISFRDLVKYTVEVSDNTAYKMLLDHFGKAKISEYGQSLGATNTLDTEDIYGNITPEDAIKYMQALNDFINNNGELGIELKTYFINAEQNDLALPEENIEAAHKYGEYSNSYHDIGIVYAEHPYLLVVLTEEGSKDFQSIVKDISKKIYELHKLYYSNREQICKTKATK